MQGARVGACEALALPGLASLNRPAAALLLPYYAPAWVTPPGCTAQIMFCSALLCPALPAAAARLPALHPTPAITPSTRPPAHPRIRVQRAAWRSGTAPARPRPPPDAAPAAGLEPNSRGLLGFDLCSPKPAAATSSRPGSAGCRACKGATRCPWRGVAGAGQFGPGSCEQRAQLCPLPCRAACAGTACRARAPAHLVHRLGAGNGLEPQALAVAVRGDGRHGAAVARGSDYHYVHLQKRKERGIFCWSVLQEEELPQYTPSNGCLQPPAVGAGLRQAAGAQAHLVPRPHAAAAAPGRSCVRLLAGVTRQDKHPAACLPHRVCSLWVLQ